MVATESVSRSESVRQGERVLRIQTLQDQPTEPHRFRVHVQSNRDPGARDRERHSNGEFEFILHGSVLESDNAPTALSAFRLF